jgi:hypothetical protein
MFLRRQLPWSRRFMTTATGSMLLVSYVLLTLVPSAMAAEFGQPKSCQDNVAVDYLRPLRELPPVHPPPEGKLGFAPSVELYSPWDGLARVGGESFGYAFSVEGPLKEWEPDWRVRAEIVRVNSKSQEDRVLDEKHRVLEEVKGFGTVDFSLPLRFGNGIFRYRLEIERLSGRRLATFEQYVRVVPRRFAARLWLNSTQYWPGDPLYFQVRNLGSLPVTFAEGAQQIEVFNGSTWEPASFQLSRGGRRVYRRATLFAGQASNCSVFTLPPDAPPGKYRLTKRVATFDAEWPHHLRATFEIN